MLFREFGSALFSEEMVKVVTGGIIHALMSKTFSKSSHLENEA